jgi:GH24 family phage-related lysozyme (muramidase)
MKPETKQKLKDHLLKWEGKKALVYSDHLGVPTVGIGHNLRSNPLSDKAIDLIYEEDAQNATLTCRDTFDEFDSFTPTRQIALVALAFQLGNVRFLRFMRMIQAIHIGDWEAAGREVLDSDAARDPLLTKRFKEYSTMLKNG